MKKTKTSGGNFSQPVSQIRRGGVMEAKRQILTLLIATVILSGFSFTLSSCKNCGKKGANPAGRDDNTNSMPSDTNASSTATTPNVTTN
jgi:hypothetical protein